MGCEHTKKHRIRFLGARPSEIRTPEDRRLVTANPELLRDRVHVSDPMWMCGPGMGRVVECQLEGCTSEATHECDGCDIAICAGHATNRGQQTLEGETGFASPGWQRIAWLDTYDLCPFCLFNPESMPKRSGAQR